MKRDARNKNVLVSLPGDLVWALWKRAESRGVSTEVIIREAFEVKVGVQKLPTSSEVTKQRILDLVNAGWDDGSISVELGRVRGYVADVRRAAGLKPNKRKSV